jgi:DNA-binding MltR family transcriptional regulator
MTKADGRRLLSIFADTRPGSIKTLRASYRDKLKMPDPERLLKEIEGESDRAAIILAAAMLDDLLLYAIAMKLSFEPTGDEIEHIFRQAGPLGSFSARMEIALYFDVIEDETYKQLDTIREMRNACAHSKHPLDLTDPALAAVAMRLFTPEGLITVAYAGRNLKGAFVAEVAFLQHVLSCGSRAEALENAAGFMVDEFLREHPSPETPPER